MSRYEIHREICDACRGILLHWLLAIASRDRRQAAALNAEYSLRLFALTRLHAP